MNTTTAATPTADARLLAGLTAAPSPGVLVRQFHTGFDAPISNGPARLDFDRAHLRMTLIEEGFCELLAAFYGEHVSTAVQDALDAAKGAHSPDQDTRDVVESADALGDLVYVIYGLALEAGIPLDAVLAEIHSSNMSKLGADGRPVLRGDGKILKGPGYFRPNLSGVLEQHATQVA